MGVVYSPEQVNSQQVPEADGSSHVEAALDLIEALRSDELGQVVDSFLIYGSVSEDRAGRRSDLDLLVVGSSFIGDTRSASFVSELASLISEVHKSRRVTIEPQYLTSVDLVNGDHTLDSLFLNHLLRAQRNPSYSFGWPVSRIAKDAIQSPDNPAIPVILKRYIVAKNRKFSGALLANFNGNDAYKVLQRVLEFPSSLGRKAVALVASPNSDVNDTILRERAIQALFNDKWFGSDPDPLQAYDKLKRIDADYNGWLEDALSGEISSSEYSEKIADILAPAITAALVLGYGALKAISIIDAQRQRASSHVQNNYVSGQLRLDLGDIPYIIEAHY